MRRGTKATAAGLAAVAAGTVAAAGARAVRRTPGHPLFARCYGVLARLAERGELGDRRHALLAGATGVVLDLGAGTGESFKHLERGVTAVVAVEPDPTMLRLSRRAAAEAAVPVRLVRARAEALPLRDASVDTVVATLVLCSVDDPGRALAEARRVLRPGGRLLFLEHVRAQAPALAAWQDRLDGAWGRIGGGCHPNRATYDAVCAAGFTVEEAESFDVRPGIALVRPHVQGAAVRT